MREIAALPARIVKGFVSSLLALSVVGCHNATLAPYSEPEELKSRAEEVNKLADPRGDLAYLRNIEITGRTVIGGTGLRPVPLDHWKGPSLTVDRSGANVVVVSSGQETLLEGKPLAEEKVLSPESEVWVTNDSLSLRLVKNGDKIRFRAFDGKSGPLQSIHAPNFYAPAEKFRVPAEWIPVPGGREMVYQRTNGGSDVSVHMDGYVQFSMDGKRYQLYGETLPADEKDPVMLFIVFRDQTSKTETYPSSRFLYVREGSREFPVSYKFDPAKRTKLMLDFNQAVNPVCAYNPNTHCPIAPPENRLPIAIPAGEKRYDPLD